MIMKFQRKPITVEANQFHPDGLPWPKGVIKSWHGFIIKTSDGWMVVKSGDWIIQEIDQNYPCDPETFKVKFIKI